MRLPLMFKPSVQPMRRINISLKLWAVFHYLPLLLQFHYWSLIGWRGCRWARGFLTNFRPLWRFCCRFHLEKSLQAALKMSETSYPPDSHCNEKWKVCVFSAPSGFNQGNILNTTGFLNRLPSAFLPDDSRSLFWSGRSDGSIKSRLFSSPFFFIH